MTLAISIDDVIRIVHDVLAKRRGKAPPPLAADTRFDQLGLESLEIAEVFALVEDEVGYELEPSSAEDVRTLADVLRLRATSTRIREPAG